MSIDEVETAESLLQAKIDRLTAELADVQRYRQTESANARKLWAALGEIKSVLNERDNIPLLMRVREIVNTALANEQKP